MIKKELHYHKYNTVFTLGDMPAHHNTKAQKKPLRKGAAFFYQEKITNEYPKIPSRITFYHVTLNPAM